MVSTSHSRARLLAQRRALALRRCLVPLGVSAAAALLSACAAIKPAQMALPTPLAGLTPDLVQGLGGGRSGEFQVGAQRGSFQRSRDRVDFFDTVSFDRATTRYSLTRADGSTVQAACRGRQTAVTIGILQGAARPYTVECRWTGALAGTMTLGADSAKAGVRSDRKGLFSTDTTTLELHSVHQVQGSPLPVDAPIGYLITHRGQPVGAVELNGTTPRLWRPAAGSTLQEPVTLAALATALLWDPAGAAP